MFIRDLNIINNPYTYYRLDPGEPGIAPPTPASKSAFTVFSQESRNRTRLQAEALIEGKDVIFVNTEYKLRKKWLVYNNCRWHNDCNYPREKQSPKGYWK